MEKNGWKTLAIIFMILFIIETLFVGLGVYLVNEEERQTNLCYYEVCDEYPEALFDEGICTCYEYDLMGEFVPAKNKIM